MKSQTRTESTMSPGINCRRPVRTDLPGEYDNGSSSSESGFSLTELMIAMLVFSIILGTVVTLLVKSQTIFRAEQGVSEMDQNARLLMDFLTRDIQQSKENSLGFGPKFRSIYSYNGAEGKTDELTVVSSDTETRIPSQGLPLMVLGPAPCPLTRIKARWRWHVLVKGPVEEIGRVVRYAAPRLETQGKARVVLDRDPVSLL